MATAPTILTVVGARPQFVKAAPVSRALAGTGLREVLVHTGQHYDHGMSQVFFEELGIARPKHNLEVGSGSHAVQTGRMMVRLEEVLVLEAPECMLIYGDTNSTAAAALTAAKMHIPVAHVEAGLRSFNRRMPEEINRIVADTLSAILFAPTDTAVENLRREGITRNVYRTGDVMYDAALQYKARAGNSAILSKLGLQAGTYVLCTIHRAENTDDRATLTGIITALSAIAEEMPVVVPIHPRTRKMIDGFGLIPYLANITVTDPAGFLDMLCLEANARAIVTDSGGVQKEAYFHRVPCITLRNETEWVETVRAGWNTLCDSSSLYDALTGSLERTARADITEYGDGHSAERIAEELRRFMA